MVFASLIKTLTGGGAGSASLEDVREASRSGSHHIIDVREAGEFAAGHVPGARNLPLSSFDPAILPGDKPVILMCLSGARSARALGACRSLGRADIRNYAGGMAGWRGAGERVATG